MIAISYRREDSLPIAGRLYDRLQATFGRQNVFMDFDSIPAGVDFRERIKQTIEQSDLVVAVIGPRWLGELNDSSRRIDEPTDFVRLEIKYALEQEIPVIPLLVDETPMPKAQKLPADIEKLAFRNALPLDSGLDFHSHVDRLITGIDALTKIRYGRGNLGKPAASQLLPSQRSKLLVLGVSALATIIGVALFMWFYGRSRSDTDNSRSTQRIVSPSASPQLSSDLTPGPRPTMPPINEAAPTERATTKASPTVAPTPTMESRLIGSWQSSRLYTEYLSDHTFKTIGLYVSGMRWKLNGTTLTQWYPELGDRTPPWYPGAGEMSFEIISIDDERMILEARDGRRFVDYRLHGDSQLEHETLAQKAKDATAKEQNGSEPPDAASLKPAMEGEVYPQTRMRRMAADEVSDWTADQMQYAINEVYARHGMTFPDKRVQQMFSKLAWYRPRLELTPAKAEYEFSEFEKANVELLADARRKLRTVPSPGPAESVAPTSAPQPSPALSIGKLFAGTWRGSARSRTSEGSTSTSTYVVRFSEDEKTVWINWDGPENGFQASPRRTGQSMTWSIRQHPGKTGTEWTMDCSLTLHGSRNASFTAKTVYTAGQFKGITGKVEGTLSR